jgi:diguanylate cyclase (GGDEF)-like protein
MAVLQKLTGIIRRHPLTSAFDISLWAVVMMTVTWAAFEYDLAMLWGEMTPRERQVSTEETIVLSSLYVIGLAVFVWRRLLEEKQDRARWRKAEADLHEQRSLAMIDPLTALPNRREFMAALEKATSPGIVDTAAIYVLDLNGFKAVNDEHGHAAGDEVLQIVAQRFLAQVRDGDLLARLGGDEFAILAPGVKSRLAASEIGARFASALSNDVTIRGRRHAIGVSIGVAFIPGDGATGQDVLHCADLAMYEAKQVGGSALRFFDGVAQIARRAPQFNSASAQR